MAGLRHLISSIHRIGRSVALLTLGLGLQFTVAAAATEAVPPLTEHAHPQQTLQGVITGFDERGDRITVRLASQHDSDFKVQDGLIFNSVRNGDRVEITVEDIGGAKTVVGLKKE